MSSLPRLRRRKRSRGQGLVEFALILPVFMLFLLIAVDFGRLLFTYIQLNNTAREAASYASFNPTSGNATLKTIALRESNVQGQKGEGTIAATSSCTDSGGNPLPCANARGGLGAGNRITVNVSETFTFFTPLIGSFWPGGLPIGASATAAIVDFAAGGGAPPPTCSTLPATPTFTWSSPDATNNPFLISVDASASTSWASPCQNIGYNWDFGGASSDPNDDYLYEGVTTQFTYAIGGTYTITLVASNAFGDSPAFTTTITLGNTTCNAPTANFTVSPAQFDNKGNSNWKAANGGGNQGTPFDFNGASSGFMADPACHPTWTWDLGDGTTYVPPTATATPPTHTYSSAWKNKTVQVKLTVTNDAGTASKTIPIPLT